MENKSVEGEEVLRVAKSYIGYHEGKGKKNKFGEWFGLNGVAWCMEFVQFCYAEAGIPLPFKTASCGQLLNWYKRNQPECITKNPIPGCIVIFDFPKTAYDTDHTGLFVSTDGKRITTIDGNTSNGSDSNGGWVQSRNRNISYANPTYIIPRGLEKVDIDKLINDMTPEQAYKLCEKANQYMASLPLPTSWDAKSELEKAIKDGITDGNNPMCFTPRYQAAIMVERAMRGKKNE